MSDGLVREPCDGGIDGRLRRGRVGEVDAHAAGGPPVINQHVPVVSVMRECPSLG